MLKKWRSTLVVLVVTVSVVWPSDARQPEFAQSAPMPMGRATQIFLGDSAQDALDALDIRYSFPSEAYLEGWQPLLMEVAISNPANSGFGCIASLRDWAGDAKQFSLTDTGGYERTARLVIRDNSDGLPWVVCPGASLAAWVLGALPENQLPAAGIFTTEQGTILLDFTPGFVAQYPLAVGEVRQPVTSAVLTSETMELGLETLAQPDENRIWLRATVTNNGGYDLTGLDFVAIDNFGRYYNGYFALDWDGRVPPGRTESFDLYITNPFPLTVDGPVTSAFITIRFENADGWWYQPGSFYADLEMQDESRAQPGDLLTNTHAEAFEQAVTMYREAIPALVLAINTGRADLLESHFYAWDSLIEHYYFDDILACNASFVLLLPTEDSDITVDPVGSSVDDDMGIMDIWLTVSKVRIVTVQCVNDVPVAQDVGVQLAPESVNLYLLRENGVWKINDLYCNDCSLAERSLN